MSNAVVLLSGGLDSTTCAFMAKAAGHQVYALSFDYGQRLARELDSAKAVAKAVGAAEHLIMKFDLTRWGGSALTADIPIPSQRTEAQMGEGIPVTYVPGRNTLFLSFGLSWAEVLEAQALYIGVNALDYSGYPDCRPEFIAAYQRMADLGTRTGIEGRGVHIETPLIAMTKAEIIRAGLAVGADYASTWSCYQGGETPCGTCDSCQLRARGFREAGILDPASRLA